AVANLTEILSDTNQTFTFDRQRTRMAWWITGQASSETIEMLAAKPTAISDYLHSIAEGKQTRLRGVDTKVFCAVTVSGNVARLVVNDWIEMPLEQAEGHVRT